MKLTSMYVFFELLIDNVYASEPQYTLVMHTLMQFMCGGPKLPHSLFALT